MTRLVKKLKKDIEIELVTGMHIGGNSDNVAIGGVDTPVIKVPTKEGQPYIPGSSLKGKIRCLLEQIAGISEIGGKNDSGIGKSSKINNLFGITSRNKEDNMPSKIIFRDAFMKEEWAERLKETDELDMPFTECKYENSIDRVKGTAISPRQIERVPAGVVFRGEIILNIWEEDNEDEMKEILENGLKALENDYLGGSGSRGYGQVVINREGKFEEIDFSSYPKSDK